MNTKLFRVTQTIDTATGQLYQIAWNGYISKQLLKDISRFAISLGWFQSGQYAIKHSNGKTTVTVSSEILKDFTETVNFLAKKRKYFYHEKR